jgi:hypothetical protein
MNNITSLKQGNIWVNKDEITTGDWSINTINEDIILSFHENFITPDGPDLKLFLSPKDINDIGVNESIQDDGLYLDVLKTVTGKQEYSLPEKEVLSNYKSLVIHCEKYTVVWGGIDIK